MMSHRMRVVSAVPHSLSYSLSYSVFGLKQQLPQQQPQVQVASRIRHFSSLLSSSSLSLFGARRLERLEREANDPSQRTNVKKQRELLAELLKTGNTRAVIQRFQSIAPSTGSNPSSSLMQSDPESLKLYIQALALEGRIDTLVKHLLQQQQPNSTSAPTTTTTTSNSLDSSSSSSAGLFPSSDSSTTPSPLTNIHGEPRLHNVFLNSSNNSSFKRSPSSTRNNISSSSSSSTFNRFNNNQSQQHQQPLQIVVSEAWSWSKFARKLGSRFLYAILLMTGLSVILDQQGIIKSGMGSAEVEPNSSQQQIKFSDVEGVDEAKEDLEEVVQFLKEPKKFMEIGGKLPKGILLYGPPGTGKTHLARAVAGEAGVPFFQMSGSEFDELYVGVGARRVRELFQAARKKAPCIVFIDEIDAVGSKRSAKDQSYMRQTLNQLLVELDGFSSSEGVIFIAATNTVEALDKALIRPGRFDKHVPVMLPDVRGRAKILAVHAKGVTFSPDVDLTTIARGTIGFSGADLANLVNQAALRASKVSTTKLGVRMMDLEWAKDKIMMGAERRSAVIKEEDKRMTAYHEGGHALLAIYTKGALPLHKVTVVPRGNALGLTMQLPEMDKTGYSKRELLASIDVCMGGRIAEEIIYGTDEVTTGASNDLEKATAYAKEMVVRYGMSDKVGPVSHSNDELDKLSTETKALIESEIKAMLEASYTRASALLKSKRYELDRLAQALVDYETLDRDEIELVIKGETLKKTIS